MEELASAALTRRIFAIRERAHQLSRLATHPTVRLEIQRALDDLNDAAGWTLRGELDAWTELARSVAVTVEVAEWRLREIEHSLSGNGRHAAATQ